MDLTTCPACPQTWALTNHGTEAAPGYSHPTGRWMNQGPRARVTMVWEGTQEVRAWTCLCGATVQVKTPGTKRVDCTYQHTEGGPCRVRAAQMTVRARQATGSCPCCGFQGTHEVRLDGEGVLPTCLTP